MKIAYCIPSCYQSGGMERVLSLKANYLADALNWEIVIITTGQRETSTHYTFSPKIRFIDLNINYQDNSHQSFISKIFERIRKTKEHRIKLAEVLKSESFDICISMFTHETAFLPSIKDGSKKILELHFSKYYRYYDCKYNHSSWKRKLISRLLDFKDRRKIAGYNAFVVLTREDATFWKNRKNLLVIPNPLSFTSSEKASLISKKAIAIGRLCPQKGFDLLLESWRFLPDELRSSWQLNIYGTGPDEKKLQTLIRSSNLYKNVSIHAPVKNIQSKLIESSLFCFPSRYEGLGMALLEAMSCGLPTISYNSPCGPKDVITPGETGELIPMFDSKKFALAMSTMMKNSELRKEYGNKAKKHVIQMYSLPEIMQKWLKLFYNLNKQNNL